MRVIQAVFAKDSNNNETGIVLQCDLDNRGIIRRSILINNYQDSKIYKAHSLGLLRFDRSKKVLLKVLHDTYDDILLGTNVIKGKRVHHDIYEFINSIENASSIDMYYSYLTNDELDKLIPNHESQRKISDRAKALMEYIELMHKPLPEAYIMRDIYERIFEMKKHYAFACSVDFSIWIRDFIKDGIEFIEKGKESWYKQDFVDAGIIKDNKRCLEM